MQITISEFIQGTGMHFSEAEVHALSDLIGLIYECILDKSNWPQVLERVCAFVGAKASRIYWRDATRPDSRTFYSHGFDPDFLSIYNERYLAANPLYPASIFVTPGEIFSSRDLVPVAEFQASRFFKEWVAPQGFVDAAIFNIDRHDASAAAFTIITGQDYGLVDEKLRTRLKLLVPHLQRAALISRAFERQELTAQTLEVALNTIEAGVFILDSNGQLVWTNKAGEQLMARGDLIRDGKSGFSLVGSQADGKLRKGLDVTFDKGMDPLEPDPALIRLNDRQGGEWLACLMPLQPSSPTEMAFHKLRQSARSALFVRRIEPVAVSGVEAAAKLYALTPAELRVLEAALDQDTVSKMAAKLGILPSTVKTHLSSIFAKTGTSRRNALVRMVMSLKI